MLQPPAPGHSILSLEAVSAVLRHTDPSAPLALPARSRTFAQLAAPGSLTTGFTHCLEQISSGTCSSPSDWRHGHTWPQFARDQLSKSAFARSSPGAPTLQSLRRPRPVKLKLPPTNAYRTRPRPSRAPPLSGRPLPCTATSPTRPRAAPRVSANAPRRRQEPLGPAVSAFRPTWLQRRLHGSIFQIRQPTRYGRPDQQHMRSPSSRTVGRRRTPWEARQAHAASLSTPAVSSFLAQRPPRAATLLGLLLQEMRRRRRLDSS